MLFHAYEFIYIMTPKLMIELLFTPHIMIMTSELRPFDLSYGLGQHIFMVIYQWISFVRKITSYFVQLNKLFLISVTFARQIVFYSVHSNDLTVVYLEAFCYLPTLPSAILYWLNIPQT